MTKRKTKKRNNNKKKLVISTIVITVFVVLFVWEMNLVLNLVGVNAMINNMKSYNEDMFLYVIENDTYCGIDIPTNVTVQIHSHLKSQRDSWLEYFFAYTDNTLGTYNNASKTIRLRNEECNSKTRRVLIHEIAHYEYHNEIDALTKYNVRQKRSLYCEDDNEFYAYLVSDYGYFEEEWIQRNGMNWTSKTE